MTAANGNGSRRPPFVLSLSKDRIRPWRLSLSKPQLFTAKTGAIL
jgi:hypothetical protein